MRRPRRRAAALLTLALAACGAGADARRAGQVRHNGRTLEEWWQLRRDASDETAFEARTAIRAIGAAGVPYLAEKAASHQLGDNSGGSVALEDLCPSALPAMESARSTYPSPALDAAIRSVRAKAAAPADSGPCAPGGDSAAADSQR
jgi:hypothetical protein